MGRGGNTDRGQGTKIGMVGGAHRERSMGRVDKGEHGVGEGVRVKVSRHREESTRVRSGGWERADRGATSQAPRVLHSPTRFKK